uniref:hypothetical protein n=1 Tax=Tessaracoccus timonensis TaxID=2161816 RepID=UPI00131ED8BC|nr:hypothetical protein [Tessaracoccus timonensis]
MVRSQRSVVIVAACIVVAVAVMVAGWWFWWHPKTEFSCDGRNAGADTPTLAASRFVTSLVERDTETACTILTNKIEHDELQAQLESLWKQLGEPTDPADIDVTIGDQGGSSFPLALEGPHGTAELSILSFQRWYRVTLPLQQ